MKTTRALWFIGGITAGLALAGGAVVYAASITTLNLIGNTNFKFHVIDMTGATEHQTVTLPTTVGNNGQVRIGKRSGGASDYVTVIQPAAGDTIDGVGGADVVLPNSGDFVMMVADEASRKWWVVNYGTSPVSQ